MLHDQPYAILKTRYYGSDRRFRLTQIESPGLVIWVGQDTHKIDPATGEPTIVARDARITNVIAACFASLTPDDLAKPYI